MDMSNCITDDITTCNIDSSLFCFFYFIRFSLIFYVFINIHKFANYANKVICLFDNEVKGLYLNFKLVPIQDHLVVYDQKQL